MSIGRFFKVPKHRQFDYKPQFYDPDKEELEERLRRAKPIDGSDTDAVKARISGSFRRGGIYGNDKYRSLASQQKKVSNIRLLVIIGGLILMVYLLLGTTSVQDFITTFQK